MKPQVTQRSDVTYMSEFTLDKLGKFVKGSIRRRH